MSSVKGRWQLLRGVSSNSGMEVDGGPPGSLSWEPRSSSFLPCPRCSSPRIPAPHGCSSKQANARTHTHMHAPHTHTHTAHTHTMHTHTHRAHTHSTPHTRAHTHTTHAHTPCAHAVSGVADLGPPDGKVELWSSKLRRGRHWGLHVQTHIWMPGNRKV